MPRIYDIEKKQWEELFKSGTTVADIAADFNRAHGTVSRHLRNVGLEIKRGGVRSPKRYREFTDEEIKIIIQSYNNGSPIYDLMKRFKATRNSIKEVLITHGIKLRNHAEAQKANLYSDNLAIVVKQTHKYRNHRRRSRY